MIPRSRHTTREIRHALNNANIYIQVTDLRHADYCRRIGVRYVCNILSSELSPAFSDVFGEVFDLGVYKRYFSIAGTLTDDELLAPDVNERVDELRLTLLAFVYTLGSELYKLAEAKKVS